jgi:putative ABC transport system substrate-binding protein
MRRREFITLLGGAPAVLLASSSSGAQSPRLPTVGFLTNSSVTRSAENLGELTQGLRDLGYIEGRQIRIIPLFSEGRSDTLPELAAQLVRLEVDVIVAAPTQAIQRCSFSISVMIFLAVLPLLPPAPPPPAT